MGCEHFREALSARLDGEDDPAERAATDAHLAGCAACRQWFDAAAAVTRLVRTAVIPEIRVSDDVLAAAPGPGAGGGRSSERSDDDGRRRLRPGPRASGASAGEQSRGRHRLVTALRVALGVLGVVQFLLGAAQIGGFAAAQHLHTSGVGGPNHLWHESAAWNVAVGAGFAWIALRRTRASGIIPTLTAFVGALTLLTASDVIAGRVDVDRVLSHAFIVAGYVIVVVLSRTAREPGEPPSDQHKPRPAWRAVFDDVAESPPRPPLRLVRERPAQARAGSWRRAA
ncbi:zf-HC2 domain-containing protein [Phytohabitans rumicis]|uniref:Membrane protein n=1 Tax=Phytohabitans rumicis TaxID=1076125 RepID=A0A6V8LNK9_9ACTN|nr:zf-HC2 domain-containing protein [Phytohabitans rumicis]GFJ95677.1 membrane protein [Phytohabitans rumicis]